MNATSLRPPPKCGPCAGTPRPLRPTRSATRTAPTHHNQVHISTTLHSCAPTSRPRISRSPLRFAPYQICLPALCRTTKRLPVGSSIAPSILPLRPRASPARPGCRMASRCGSIHGVPSTGRRAGIHPPIDRHIVTYAIAVSHVVSVRCPPALAAQGHYKGPTIHPPTPQLCLPLLSHRPRAPSLCASVLSKVFH